jgi:hypothetical protein
LESGATILGDEIDTTGQRLRSGFLRVTDVQRRLDGDSRAVVLLRVGGSGLSSLAELKAHLERDYRLVATFVSHTGIRHLLYARQRASP